MNSRLFITQEIAKTIDVMQMILGDQTTLATIDRVAVRCASSIAAGNKIMFCGNGGSAADSQHLAAEFIGKFLQPRSAMAGLALTTDTSTLTAVANDFGFEHVFARQVEGIGRSGDVLVGISTSGRSQNVIRAFESARSLSILTIALTGRQRAGIAELADEWIAVPSDETQKIQEAHIILGHTLCALVEAHLHKETQAAARPTT